MWKQKNVWEGGKRSKKSHFIKIIINFFFDDFEQIKLTNKVHAIQSKRSSNFGCLCGRTRKNAADYNSQLEMPQKGK
jgi:hypothetical protein